MTVRVRLSEDPRNPRAIASQERGCGQHAARCQPMARRAAPVRVARGRTCSPLALALALATSRCQSVSLVRVLRHPPPGARPAYPNSITMLTAAACWPGWGAGRACLTPKPSALSAAVERGRGQLRQRMSDKAPAHVLQSPPSSVVGPQGGRDPRGDHEVDVVCACAAPSLPQSKIWLDLEYAREQCNAAR